MCVAAHRTMIVDIYVLWGPESDHFCINEWLPRTVRFIISLAQGMRYAGRPAGLILPMSFQSTITLSNEMKAKPGNSYLVLPETHPEHVGPVWVLTHRLLPIPWCHTKRSSNICQLFGGLVTLPVAVWCLSLLLSHLATKFRRVNLSQH